MTGLGERDGDRNSEATQDALLGILQSFERRTLENTLLCAAAQDPNLAAFIMRQSQSLAGRSDAAPPESSARKRSTVDRTALIAEIREIKSIPAVARSCSDYHGMFVAAILNQLRTVAERARPYLDAEDTDSALTVLSTVTDEIVADVEDLQGDEGEEFREVVECLGELLAEAFLAAPPADPERREWRSRFETWLSALENYGQDEDLQVASVALDHGWEFTAHFQTDAYIPTSSYETGTHENRLFEGLADVGLRVLERRRDWEGYLELARLGHRLTSYVGMLIRLGRIEEAERFGLTRADNAEVGFALVEQLDAAGAPESALRVGAHLLEHLSNSDFLYGWLAGALHPIAEREGKADLALVAALEAVWENMQLADFQVVERLAGDRWPEYRDQVAEKARNYPFSATLPDRLAILIYAGAVESAMALVDESERRVGAELVVDAVQESHPEWVFQTSTRIFDRIADSARSKEYHEALAWMARARQAMLRFSSADEWRSYLKTVITRHSRKSSLRPGLEQLLR